jgi:uncharacterized coiled-coil protein SlyX
MTEESLDDILKGTSAVVPDRPVAEPAEVHDAPVKEPEATPVPARDESGKFAKTEVAQEAAKAEPEKLPVTRDVAGIIDERRKRQALEARLREIESKPEQQKVSVFEDEDKGIAQRVDSGVRPLRAQLFTQSMRLARIEHKDFGEAESAFMDAAEADPRLYEQLRAAEDPGDYIYSIGSHIKELGPYGGNLIKRDEAKFADLRTQITERDTKLAAMQAQLDALTKAQADLDAVPRSLNKSPSATSGRTQVAEDDEPLSKIVRFGNT